MASEKDIAFAREVLRTVFGLDKQTIDNVIREIRATSDVSAIKTTMIRQRVGAHALRLIRNGINAAKESAPVDDEEDDDQQDEFGADDEQDMRSSAEDEQTRQRKQHTNKGAGLESPGAAAPVRAESVNQLHEQTEYTAIGYFDQKQDSKYQRRKITAASPEEAAKQMQKTMKKLAKERKGSQKHSKVTRVLDPSGKEVWNHKKNNLNENKKGSRGEFDILKESLVDVESKKHSRSLDPKERTPLEQSKKETHRQKRHKKKDWKPSDDTPMESVNEAGEYPKTLTVKFGSLGAARTAHESLSDKYAKRAGVSPAKLSSMSQDNSFKVTVQNQTGYQKLREIVKNYRGEVQQSTNESNSRGEFDILKEFLVDVDPHDEEQLISIRRMMKMAQQPGGEERLLRQLVQNADEERDQGRRNGNRPADNINQQINRLKYQINLLQRRKASLERREQEGKEQGTRQQRQNNERQ